MQNTTLSQCALHSPGELASTGTRRKRQLVAVAAAFAVAGTLALPMVARADTWNGSTSANWNTGANWSTTAVPTATDTAVFDGTDGNAEPVVTLTGAAPVSGITFNGTEAYTIGSTASSTNALQIGLGGVTVNANVAENLYGPITLTASSAFTNNGTGMLTLGDSSYGTTAPIANNELTFSSGATLTIAGTGNVTIDSTVNLSSAVVANMSGTGTLYLNSAEGSTAYGIGSLTVDGGYVETLKTGQLAYAGALIINGGTYDMNGTADAVTKSLSGTGGILTNSSAAGAGLSLFTSASANATYTYGGDITGNIQLSDHNGTGQVLTLSGTNNFGNTAVSSTAISINNFTLTITGNTTVSGQIAVTPASAGYVGVLGGNGTLTQATQANGISNNGIVLARTTYGSSSIAELAPSAGLSTAGGNKLTIITPYGLHFSGGLYSGLTSYSKYACDIGPAGVSDSVALTGHLYLDPTYSILDLAPLAGAFDGSTYTIFSYTTLTGTFGSVEVGGVEGLPSNYMVDYLTDNEIRLVYTGPVPEPASLALLAIGMVAMLVSRRRRVCQ